jgi:hypothetical protein
MKFKLNCLENDIDNDKEDPNFVQKAQIHGCDTKIRDLSSKNLNDYVVRASIAGIKPFPEQSSWWEGIPEFFSNLF